MNPELLSDQSMSIQKDMQNAKMAAMKRCTSKLPLNDEFTELPGRVQKFWMLEFMQKQIQMVLFPHYWFEKGT